MKHYNAIIGTCLLFTAYLLNTSAYAAEAIEIDLSATTGPALHRASGMLWGLTADKPGDERVDPLKFNVYRGRLTAWIEGSGIKSMQRMSDKGCRIQAVLSDEYFLDERSAGKKDGVTYYTNPNDYDTSGGFSYSSIEIWPGDLLKQEAVQELLPDHLPSQYIVEQEDGTYIDMTFIWDDVVERCFAEIQAAGLDVEWDFWEEPNWKGWFGPLGDDQAGNWQRFYELYVHTYKKLKHLDPNAKVVGPSANRYDYPGAPFLGDFLAYAKAHDAIPNSLSWHEIGELKWQQYPHQILGHVEGIRAYMEANDIEMETIDINEFVSDDRQNSAAMYVWYFAMLEQAKVSSACRAVWREPDGTFNGWSPMLGGLLTKDLQPRATWWVHKAYADITGTLLELSHTGRQKYPNVVGLAGIDRNEKVLRILLGKLGGHEGPYTVTLSNMDQYPSLVQDGRARVMAEKIPNSGWKALQAPIPHLDETQQIHNGEMTIELENFEQNEAMTIMIQAP